MESVMQQCVWQQAIFCCFCYFQKVSIKEKKAGQHLLRNPVVYESSRNVFIAFAVLTSFAQ